MLHPREQIKLAIAATKKSKVKTSLPQNGFHAPRRQFNNSAAWLEIGGKKHYFRSKWEKNFVRYLQFLKDNGEILDWEYEPETFWFEGIKRGVNNYKPDFKVTSLDGSIIWYEVKGFMDPKSKTKIKRMAKYHPEINLYVCDEVWWRKTGKKLGVLIKDWE